MQNAKLKRESYYPVTYIERTEAYGISPLILLIVK